MPDQLQIDMVNIGDSKPVELFMLKRAVIDFNTSGDHTVVAAVTAKKIRVLGIKFSVASDVSTTWKSASTALSPAETWKAGGGMSDYWGPHGVLCETNPGEALVLNLSGNVQISGWINYLEI